MSDSPDEGLRDDDHPAIVFRDGPVGRRASVVGGPDVWEVVRAVVAARLVEPDLTEAELIVMLEENTGVSRGMTAVALAYWRADPRDVDARIERAQRDEANGAAAAERNSGVQRP